MNYVSTRDKNNRVSSAEAIAHGISKEGGLFVPESFPKFSGEDFENLKKLDYIGSFYFNHPLRRFITFSVFYTTRQRLHRRSQAFQEHSLFRRIKYSF